MMCNECGAALGASDVYSEVAIGGRHGPSALVSECCNVLVRLYYPALAELRVEPLQARLNEVPI